MSFIMFWKVDGELQRPKYMTSVMKAAFHSSPSLTRTLLYPHRRSILVKSLQPLSLSTS
ncbi:hypothetical protein M404DRAFT_170367 [Pisolithus tinctorius Marx 270]|uniref:Uncharacterized protein n=1 Tax=Pisolithus tinctorius Marx 270 TaxID=870435 RepID=A0A0C3I9F4_PISTI|nr:hypothetical protein M404DRAFT_170367 [Pisolithus tinctorius Marx 270]